MQVEVRHFLAAIDARVGEHPVTGLVGAENQRGVVAFADHAAVVQRDGRLVGGVYGVSIGAAFFGESMFSRETQASKVALTCLQQRLHERGFILHDTQWTTPHLEQFGAVEIPREDYLRRLAVALRGRAEF